MLIPQINDEIWKLLVPHPKTNKSYKSGIKPLILALNKMPIKETKTIKLINQLININYVYFEDYDNYRFFIKDLILKISKNSMQRLFTEAYSCLVKELDFPPLKFDWIKYRPTPHQGFSASERQKILDYCLSEVDNQIYGTIFKKWLCVLFLQSGIRCFEYNQVYPFFLQKEIKQIYKFTGKKNKIRHFYRTETINQMWQKVVNSNQKKLCQNYNDSQILKMIKCILSKVNIKGTTHDFRVSYATYLNEKVDIYTIQKSLGHTSIEQTIGYIRNGPCEATFQKLNNALSLKNELSSKGE